MSTVISYIFTFLAPEAPFFLDRLLRLSSRPKNRTTGGGEVEWRDPDNLSRAMSHQGVLPMHFHLCMTMQGASNPFGMIGSSSEK